MDFNKLHNVGYYNIINKMDFQGAGVKVTVAKKLWYGSSAYIYWLILI